MLSARSLVYFLATLETGSFTATARIFSVSVPTVSASIARLEHTLGYALFLRGPRRLLPSQAAAAAESAARSLLEGLLAIEGFGDTHEVFSMAALRRCHQLRISPLLVARFVAVFDAKSIGGAATLLSITQPQITRQIASLEAIVGHRLFDRHPQGMAAIAAGEALYARARALCDVASDMVGHGNRLFVEGLNTTWLGSVPPFHPDSRLAGLLAELCVNWSAGKSGGRLCIATDITDVLLAGLMAGKLHAVVVETDAIPEECDSLVLLQSELDLVVGRADLAPDPEFILTTVPVVFQGRASGLRRKIDDWLGRREIVPPRILEIDAMPVIGRLIASHGYCSLIPGGAFPMAGLLAQRIVLPDAPVFSQRLVWRRDQASTRHIRRLLQLISRLG